MQTSEIVLVGGSGKTGGRIIKRLEARGLAIRVASRSSARPFDWEDRSTWRGALEGASSAYVAFQPDLSVAWAAEAIEALARVAVECGLEHIVLLSGRGEEGAQRSEAALKASGIDTTILRASWFCQNFSEAPSWSRSSLAACNCRRARSANLSSMPTTSPMPPSPP